MLSLFRLHARRVFFGLFFFGLAGFSQFHGVGDDATLGSDILTTLIFLVIIGVLGFVGVMVFPMFRMVMELSALMYFVLTILHATPLAPLLARIPDWAELATFCLSFAALQGFMYGNWWQKAGFGLETRLQSSFVANVSPREVWARLVPDQHNIDAYYSGTLRKFEPVSERENGYVMQLGIGTSAVVEVQVDVTETVPFQKYAHRFYCAASKRNRHFNEGEIEITLTDLGDNRTQVDMLEINHKQPVGDALMCWFDNLGAQVAVSASALLNGKRDMTYLGRLRREVVALS